MELDAMQRLIQKYVEGHADFMARAYEGDRYYRVKNDILYRPPKKQELKEQETENPLRQADNRVPFAFYELLVNQKAGYLFTAAPVFDTGDDALNQQVQDDLGDDFARTCKDLCINASNAGVAWLYYWQEQGKGFQYGVVPSYEIIPIWNRKLNRELIGVLRVYSDLDDAGDTWTVYEYWNDTACMAYRKRVSDDWAMLSPYPEFTDFYAAGMSDAENVMQHGMGRVPFLPFPNNNNHTRDLDKIKSLIDTYDKTFSGFVDDLEDIKQVIFVLTNYGGADLKEFMKDLKYYKAIKVESAGDGDRSGVSTLSIEIPVEACEKLLELTRKAIFSMGQGVDPEQQSLDKTSGEAMKFMYALLELKAGLMETEFRRGLADLVRAIAHFHGREVAHITQTWTRTSIRNDAELVQMCSQSAGIVSKRTILANHPFVENVEDEMERIDQEAKEQEARMEDLPETFSNGEGGESDGVQASESVR